MTRGMSLTVIAALATGAVLAGQGGNVDKILADARAALGGEKKLAGLKSFAATGRSTRVVGEESQPPADAEVAFELPDRYVKKDTLAVMGSALTRTSGFNGEAVIDVTDQPPAMAGRIVIRMSPGGGPPGVPQTAEQQEETRQRQLLAAKQDFARLALGLLLPATPAYPLTYAFGGQAESPDGKADIVDVKGEGDFAVRLFIDTETHLPLMLSWMAREPLRLTASFTSAGAGGGARAGGGAVVLGGQRAGGPPTTPEEREQWLKQLEEQRKEAEARLRTVEYRLYYGDYREVDGIKVPFRLQRSIDGKPTEELDLEKVKINGKIDPAKFEVGEKGK